MLNLCTQLENEAKHNMRSDKSFSFTKISSTRGTGPLYLTMIAMILLS